MAHVCYFRPMAVACARSSHSQHTVLHVAALHGDHRCVGVVLRADAVVDATNLQHKTPLHLAVEAGHLEVVKLLLEAGACVDQRAPTTSHRCTLHDDGKIQWDNELWWSPLEIAVDRGLRAIAMWLVGAGAEHVEVPRQYRLSLRPGASEAEVSDAALGGGWLIHARERRILNERSEVEY